MTDTKAPAGMMGDTAPERIIHREPTKGKPFYTTPVEYVRADLHASQQATIDALTAALREIRDEKLIVTRHFSGPSPEDELDATVDYLEALNLQEIAAAALGGTTNDPV